MAILAQVAVVEIGEGRAGMIAAFAAHNADEIGGVGDTGDGIQKGGTDPTENGAVGGNPQGEC